MDSTNKNAIIRSRVSAFGVATTETARRDSGSLNVTATTDERSNSTVVAVEVPSAAGTQTFELNGHAARTLYRVLSRHYDFTGKSAY